jgi:hypothetical protein
MASQLTIRGVSEELSRRLARLSRERCQSLNATTLELLENAVGVDERKARLNRYMTWSSEDREEFEVELRAQRVIDPRMWD